MSYLDRTHAARWSVMTFDSDFYATIAQILPVLVLALSVEVGLDSFFGFSGRSSTCWRR